MKILFFFLAITLVIVSAERNLNKNAFAIGNLNKMVSMVKNGSFSPEKLNSLTSTICPNGNANCCIRIYGASNAPSTRLSCGNAALYSSVDAIVANGFVISTVDPEANGQTTWESSGCVTTPLSMSTLGGAATCSATSNDVCVVTGSSSVYNLGTSTTTFDTCTCQTTTTPNCGATTATCLYCPPTNPNCCGTTCKNTNTDTNNCGTCGNTCGSGLNSGLPNCCSGSCVNEQADTNNCGGCGVVCSGGKTCTNGACVSVVSVPAIKTFTSTPTSLIYPFVSGWSFSLSQSKTVTALCAIGIPNLLGNVDVAIYMDNCSPNTAIAQITVPVSGYSSSFSVFSGHNYYCQNLGSPVVLSSGINYQVVSFSSSSIFYPNEYGMNQFATFDSTVSYFVDRFQNPATSLQCATETDYPNYVAYATNFLMQ